MQVTLTVTIRSYWCGPLTYTVTWLMKFIRNVGRYVTNRILSRLVCKTTDSMIPFSRKLNIEWKYETDRRPYRFQKDLYTCILVKNASNWTTKDSFEKFRIWGVQNCPWLANFMHFWPRYMYKDLIDICWAAGPFHIFTLANWIYLNKLISIDSKKLLLCQFYSKYAIFFT